MANNMMNMQQMMKQAKKMQADLEKKQEAIESQDFLGQDPSGMVQVTLGGNKKVKAIKMDPEAVDPDDTDMLSDLLIAAFNQAVDKVDQETQSQLGNIGQGFPQM